MRKTKLSPLCLLSRSLRVSVSVSLCVSDSLSHTQASKLSNLKGIREWKLLSPRKKKKKAYLFDQSCIRPRPWELLHHQSCSCWEALLLFLHQSCSRWEALLLFLLHQLCLCLEVLHLLLRRYHHRSL
jgi:hypothetical protein